MLYWSGVRAVTAAGHTATAHGVCLVNSLSIASLSHLEAPFVPPVAVSSRRLERFHDRVVSFYFVTIVSPPAPAPAAAPSASLESVLLLSLFMLSSMTSAVCIHLK